jgi:hypothetical protein
MKQVLVDKKRGTQHELVRVTRSADQCQCTTESFVFITTRTLNSTLHNIKGANVNWIANNVIRSDAASDHGGKYIYDKLGSK